MSLLALQPFMNFKVFYINCCCVDNKKLPFVLPCNLPMQHNPSGSMEWVNLLGAQGADLRAEQVDIDVFGNSFVCRRTFGTRSHHKEDEDRFSFTFSFVTSYVLFFTSFSEFLAAF